MYTFSRAIVCLSGVQLFILCSRSNRGLLFKEMRQHLHDLCKGSTPDKHEVVEVELVELMTDIAGRVRDKSQLTQHLHMVNSLRQSLYLRIHPTSEL